MITSQRAKHGILVMATECQMRQALERALSNQGYRILVAGDLANSLSLAADPTVQLCVMQWEEGAESSAIEMVKRLRLETSVSRFILITDSLGDGAPLSEVGEGVQLLARPFSMLEFIAVVDQAQP